MKNQKILSAAFAVLALGGLTATAAAAQSNDDGSAPSAESVESSVDTGGTEAEPADRPEGERPEGERLEGERPGADRLGRHGRPGGCEINAAIEALGIDRADLRDAMRDGESIADVAEANGVDVDDVIAALVESATERINDAVTEGRLTQAEADERLADVEARVTDRVNHVREGAPA